MNVAKLLLTAKTKKSSSAYLIKDCEKSASCRIICGFASSYYVENQHCLMKMFNKITLKGIFVHYHLFTYLLHFQKLYISYLNICII